MNIPAGPIASFVIGFVAGLVATTLPGGMKYPWPEPMGFLFEGHQGREVCAHFARNAFCGGFVSFLVWMAHNNGEWYAPMTGGAVAASAIVGLAGVGWLIAIAARQEARIAHREVDTTRSQGAELANILAANGTQLIDELKELEE